MNNKQLPKIMCLFIGIAIAILGVIAHIKGALLDENTMQLIIIEIFALLVINSVDGD